jgi:hypothetical protein
MKLIKSCSMFAAFIMLTTAGSAHAANQKLSGRAAQNAGLQYDFVLEQPQYPLVRLAVDTAATPPRLLGIGKRGEVYLINVYIGAPVLERLPKVTPPPPPSLTVEQAATGSLMAARYAEPVQDGQAIIGWRTVQVRQRDGRILGYRLPEGQVFNDQKPLFVDLGQDSLQEILVVRKDADGGSRMVVLLPKDDTLAAVAETPPAPDQGLVDPVGLADLEGNGQDQLVLVSSPGGDGYLETYFFEQGKLVRKWRLYGFSTRVPAAGVDGVSAFVDLNGDAVTDILLPRNDLLGLSVISMAGGYSRPLWRQEFSVPLATAFVVVPEATPETATAHQPRLIAFLLQDGRLGILNRRATRSDLAPQD